MSDFPCFGPHSNENGQAIRGGCRHRADRTPQQPMRSVPKRTMRSKETQSWLLPGRPNFGLTQVIQVTFPSDSDGWYGGRRTSRKVTIIPQGPPSPAGVPRQ
jgi:hypothetical protein